MEILKYIFDVKSFSWWNISGLLLGLLGILSANIAIHQTFNNAYITLTLVIISCLIWFSTWFIKNRLKKVKKNKIGILICIHSKDSEVDERVREDFVLSLKNSLDENNVNNFYDILVTPYHIASRYEHGKDALVLLNKTKRHFLLFGLVRKRNHNHVLDLTAYVRHLELTNESNNRFKSDISAAWISRYKLRGADETFELFELSSEVVSLCSRYIIALAAFASLDLTTAELLFVNVKNAISKNKYPNLPAIRTIRKNLTNKLNTIYFIQAQRYLLVWNETNDNHNISIMNEILGKVFGVYKRNGEYLTLKAISEVVLNSNYYRAKRYLSAIKKEYRDAIWYLNSGFLESCLNNEHSALDNYNAAIKINTQTEDPLSLEKISEFEDFICWYMKKGNNPHLQYLLGVLNEHFKGDLVQAVKDYTHFLDVIKPNELNTSVNISSKKILELSEQINAKK